METLKSMTNLPEPTFEELLRAAQDAARSSYSPYSGFRVGAALLLSNGHTVTGANVENVSYGLTICAERAALVRAVAEFGPEIRVAAAVVVNLNDAASPPCGACRQVLAEFMDAEATVSFPAAQTGAAQTGADLTGAAEAETARMVTMSFHELMPHAFDLKLK